MSLPRFPLFILLSSILLAALLYWSFPSKTHPNQVFVFREPRTVNSFQMGPAFSEKNFAKHWSFLFFGFTHCSDICPATLRELKEADLLLRARYPELQVVFVSIDPEHDDAAATRHYVSAFDSHFIGLRGTALETQKLQEQFAVLAEHDSLSPENINHSNSLFLINPQGQWVAVFPYGLHAKEIQDNFQTIVDKASHV